MAVKRLLADSPDELLRRFAREARLGAALSHPNLVSVFDTLTDPGGMLIVMEYVEGETLAAALRRGPLWQTAALALLREMVAALDHAHAHGSCTVTNNRPPTERPTAADSSQPVYDHGAQAAFGSAPEPMGATASTRAPGLASLPSGRGGERAQPAG